MTKSYLTTQEAARILGVTPRRVRQLLESGRLIGELTGEPGRNGARGTLAWLVWPGAIEAYQVERARARQERINRFMWRYRYIGKHRVGTVNPSMGAGEDNNEW